MTEFLKSKIIITCICFAVCLVAFMMANRIWRDATSTGKPNLGMKGRQIYLALFEKSMNAETWDETIWPKAGQYESSTSFFRAMVTNGWIRGVDFGYFGWKGLKCPTDAFDPMSFTSENNAWCIVEGLSSNTPPDTPCLFTRNVGFGPKKEAPITGTTLDQMTGLNKSQMPLRNEACVVVTFGGKVKVLARESAVQTNFNPTGSSLPVLAP